MLKYEIYSIEEKTGYIACEAVCTADKIDGFLKELKRNFPGKTWFFGVDIHFRRGGGEDEGYGD